MASVAVFKNNIKKTTTVVAFRFLCWLVQHLGKSETLHCVHIQESLETCALFVFSFG